jgi:phosphopantothenoylcysteine synthetase/decarboxylase
MQAHQPRFRKQADFFSTCNVPVINDIFDDDDDVDDDDDDDDDEGTSTNSFEPSI